LGQHDAERAHHAVVMVVKVAGVQGETAAQLNGVYAPVREDSGELSMYNGKPLFRKRNYTQRFSATWFSAPDAFWLRFAKDNTWKFSNTSNKDSNNNLGLCSSVLIGKYPSKVAEDPGEADSRDLPKTRDLRLLRLHMKNFPLDNWNIWNGSNAQVNAQMKCTVYEDIEDEKGKMKAHESVEEEVLSSCQCVACTCRVFVFMSSILCIWKSAQVWTLESAVIFSTLTLTF
jgi:hypothetical protein